MATDIARLSFDPARHYTGVVAQQGRVTLEAEQNEQRVIDAEERRLELIDIIGPAGTPDNGYVISPAAGSDFTIGAGTMYAGGLRVTLDHPIPYSNQPDWLDHTDDPDWIAPSGKLGPYEHVVLVIQERDVTAVEDPALREAALGGPDGSARTILLQHVERKPINPVNAQDCDKALTDDEQTWTSQGLIFDPATMQLRSQSRLLVTWQGSPEPPDPCEPASTGGYLGAENQLIRVQITAVDPVKGAFDLVWGWDNASFLYRVTADSSTNPVFTLDRSPADDYHRPRAGQALQVLRAAAELRSTDAWVEGYVAALHGQVVVLTAPYDPDTKTVQFPAALPASYTDPKETPQLYLRVWEEHLTGNAIGTPITLTGTGVQVTISLDGPGPVHVDDYWCIGVRPSTSTQINPHRYLRTPQPPDGPRQWACPLAVISSGGKPLAVKPDCRRHFRPLIDLQPVAPT
jgi:hypothetical protein